MPYDTTVKYASQKKSTSSCWFPRDLGRGKTTRQKGVWKEKPPNEMIHSSSRPGVSTHSVTWILGTIQLQVVVKGKRKLKQPQVTQFRGMPSAAVCPAGILPGLFLSLPHHQQARQMQIASASNPSLAKCRDDHHTVFYNNLYNTNYSQPLNSVHTKDCNLNLALHRFSGVGAGNQANSLF